MAEKKSSGEKAPTRSRHWVCIVYPESAPENWRQILDDEHVAYIVSPLHDQDINPGGEPKKPHWHLMICYSSVKTREQAREITDKLNAPSPEPVASFRGQVRYFAHLDNPEKHQYNKAEIETHGIEIDDALRSSEHARQKIIDAMCDFCDENGIIYFRDLANYARHNEPEWAEALTTNCGWFMDKYLKSTAYKLEKEGRI